MDTLEVLCIPSVVQKSVYTYISKIIQIYIFKVHKTESDHVVYIKKSITTMEWSLRIFEAVFSY